MGSTQAEVEAEVVVEALGPYEEALTPQHRVTIKQPFAVAKFAVTFAEWEACVADDGCGNYNPSDKGWGRDDRPVINVSWKDAQAYVEWLSRQDGQDLPPVVGRRV